LILDADQTPFTVHARKLVVLSAGPLSTPLILERSGIGSASHLQSIGINTVVSDLPGVGNHLQDHPVLVDFIRVNAKPEDTSDDIVLQVPEIINRAVKEYETGKGPLATNFIDAGIKLRPSDDEVKSMSPEFQKYWQEKFAGNTEKPVILSFLLTIRPYMGYPSPPFFH
jgi:alcohol oxidase